METDPDLFVLYYTSSQNVTEITRTGYYGAFGSVSARNYEDGTLVIDLMDAASEHLVWRGTAEAALSENPAPEEVEKAIRTAVDKIFSGYPPR